MDGAHISRFYISSSYCMHIMNVIVSVYTRFSAINRMSPRILYIFFFLSPNAFHIQRVCRTHNTQKRSRTELPWKSYIYANNTYDCSK